MADDTIKFESDLTFTQTNELFRIYGENNETLVTMTRAGKITFGSTYQPDEAARLWWETVSRLVPVELLARDTQIERLQAALREGRDMAATATAEMDDEELFALTIGIYWILNATLSGKGET